MSYVVLAIASSVIAPWYSPGLNQDPEPLGAAAIYRNSIESVVWVTNEGEGYGGIGTGFVVFDSSTIATSWHVIKDAKKITVRFSDGTEVIVDGVLGIDRAADLALLKIRETSRKPLPIRKGDPDIGEQVFAIGNPRGLDFSIADGIVSQIREMYGKKHYQHSINTTQGNSGGPVLDDRGRVVGVQRSGIRGESALKFASSALGLNEFDRDIAPMENPGLRSGSFAWLSEREVIGLPQALVGRREVLLAIGDKITILDIQTGEAKSRATVPKESYYDRFVSNGDGSTFAIVNSGSMSVILHRTGSEAYDWLDRDTLLKAGPVISESGTVFNLVSTTVGVRVEAIDGAELKTVWSKNPNEPFVLEGSERGPTMLSVGLTLVQNKFLVLHFKNWDDLDSWSYLSVLDAENGEALWSSKEMAEPVASPLGVFYYNTPAGPLMAKPGGGSYQKPRFVKGVVAATGKEVYSRSNGRAIISVGPDGTVYLSDETGFFAMNPELTEVKWRLSLGSPLAHRAVFDSEGSLFAPLKDGRMIAVDAETGRLRWSYSSGASDNFSGPASVEDGMVVAKTRFGTVIAIRD